MTGHLFPGLIRRISTVSSEDPSSEVIYYIERSTQCKVVMIIRKLEVDRDGTI